MRIVKPKYGIGEIVIIDCPDNNCRRKHKGTIVSIGSHSLELYKCDTFTGIEGFGPVIWHPICYIIKYRNNIQRLVEEEDIMKVDTIATMKSMKNE